MSKTFAISIVRTLREHGHQAYLVGGCVRDLLLGREPADYDVATDAMPDQVMRIFPETYAVGAQFGVVLVPLPESDRRPQPEMPPSGAKAPDEKEDSNAALKALLHPNTKEEISIAGPEALRYPNSKEEISIAGPEALRYPRSENHSSSAAANDRLRLRAKQDSSTAGLEALRPPEASGAESKSVHDRPAVREGGQGVTRAISNPCHSERSSAIRERIGDTVEESLDKLGTGSAVSIRQQSKAEEQKSGPGRLGAKPEEWGHSHKSCVEVATFRRDVGYSDGRHPDEVQFSRDPREDVQRRDFTINGLLLDPEKPGPEENEVLDFVGGQDDLRAGLIRAIGDPELRFAEDKLRMLRAVRFAARFEYKIEPKTFAAIQKLAPQISQVSRERVRDELTRMLIEGHAAQAFELLDQCGLLREVLPEIHAMKGVEQPPEFHPEGDVFVHTMLLLRNLPHPCPATLAWGALQHDVGKPPTFRQAPDRIRFDEHASVGAKVAEEICRRLHFSNDDTDQIVSLVANHMKFQHVQQMKDSTFKRFIRMPRFGEHLELHRIDCESSHRSLRLYDYVRQRVAELPPEAVRPVPLVSGDDLIAAGYGPGPRFKGILSAVEDGQLEGRLHSRDDAMEYVRREFPLPEWSR